MIGATQGPQNRAFQYGEILPNVGPIYDISPRMSIYANYSRGLQVPSTDLLYNSFFYPAGSDRAEPDAGNDRQYRRRHSLPVEPDPGPAFGLVHGLQEPDRPGL